MPSYRVISASTKTIQVCNLIVADEDGRMGHLDVKFWTGENGKALIGKEILVSTTNREVIPDDVTVNEYVVEPVEAEVPEMEGIEDE